MLGSTNLKELPKWSSHGGQQEGQGGLCLRGQPVFSNLSLAQNQV